MSKPAFDPSQPFEASSPTDAKPAFDPGKPFEPAKPAEVGAGTAIARGLGQGATFGFGDELKGGVSAALSRWLPESMGGNSDEENARPEHSFKNEYLRARDGERRGDNAADAAHPYLYGGSKILASMPAAIATGGIGRGASGGLQAVEQGLGAAMKSGAGSGALYGAVQGAGDSKADDVGGVLKDTAFGTVTGAALGAAIPVGVAGAKGLYNWGAPVVNKALDKVAPRLAEAARGSTRRAITNGANRISAKKLNLTPEVLDNALENDVVGYGRNIKGVAKRLEDIHNQTGEEIGAMRGALNSDGVGGAKAAALEDRLANSAAKAGDRSTPEAAEVYRKAADDVGKVSVDDAGRMNLLDAEAKRGAYQREANAAYAKPESQLTPADFAKKDAAAQFRQAIEDEVEAQLAAREAARAAPRAPSAPQPRPPAPVEKTAVSTRQMPPEAPPEVADAYAASTPEVNEPDAMFGRLRGRETPVDGPRVVQPGKNGTLISRDTPNPSELQLVDGKLIRIPGSDVPDVVPQSQSKGTVSLKGPTPQGPAPVQAENINAAADAAQARLDAASKTNPGIHPDLQTRVSPRPTPPFPAETPVPDSVASQFESSFADDARRLPAPEVLHIPTPGIRTPVQEVGSPVLPREARLPTSAEYKAGKKAFALNEPAHDAAQAALHRFEEGGGVGIKDLIGGGPIPDSIASLVPGGRWVNGALSRQVTSRMNSTAAKAAYDLSGKVGRIGKLALTDPSKLGPYGGVLSRAAARGGSSLAVTEFLLQNDKNFQELKKKLDESPNESDPAE